MLDFIVVLASIFDLIIMIKTSNQTEEQQEADGNNSMSSRL